jgi:hypothetical protein
MHQALHDLPKSTEPALRRKEKVATIDPSKHRHNTQGPYILKRDLVGWYKARPLDIAVISAIAFRSITRKNELETYHTTLYKIEQVIKEKTARAAIRTMVRNYSTRPSRKFPRITKTTSIYLASTSPMLYLRLEDR